MMILNLLITVCGLKQRNPNLGSIRDEVTPYVGVWIET